MVDIQSAAVEIRRGIKKEKETTGQKYNVRICYAGRPLLVAVGQCIPLPMHILPVSRYGSHQYVYLDP